MAREKMKSAAGMAVYLVAALAAVTALNALAARENRHWDFSEQAAFTLSDQSVKLVRGLEREVTLYAFTKPESRAQAKDLLDLYAYHSPKVSVRYLDPDRDPALAKKFNVTDYQTIIVEAAGGRAERAMRMEEADVTQALFKAVTAAQKNVFVLKGHGERDPEELKPIGWSGAKAALESALYKVNALDWFTTGGIPPEADLLIIPAPRQDLREQEIAALKGYVERGGALLAMLDPGRLPAFEEFLAGYGFKLNDDNILDPLSQRLGFDPLVATLTTYPPHPVTEGFTAAVFFPVARSMTLREDNPRKAKLTAIGMTAPQSWGETDLESIQAANPVFSERSDFPGPLVVAASAQWEEGPPPEERKVGDKPSTRRMIVTGDSDFASNSTLGLQANRDLFLNMVNWLAGDEERISIRPKSRGFNPIFFSVDQLRALFAASVLAIPALVGFAGVAVVVIRRRR